MLLGSILDLKTINAAFYHYPRSGADTVSTSPETEVEGSRCVCSLGLDYFGYEAFFSGTVIGST